MKLKLTLNLISNLKKTRDSHSLKNSSKKLTRTQKSKKNWEKLVYLAWKWPFLSKKHEKSRDSGSKIAIWAEKTWKNSSFSSLLAVFSKIFSTQTRTLFIFDFGKNSQLFENWKMSYFFNSHSHSNSISLFWKTQTRTQFICDFQKNSKLFKNWKNEVFFNSHSHSNSTSKFWKTRTRTHFIFDFRKNSQLFEN